MVQLNLYQFLHGYSTGVCTQIIQFISGIRLRHVPNVQGYFDGLLAMPDNVPGIREWNSTIDSS